MRLENETLSDVVSVVSFSADLDHILERVVELLTRASRCHACFIYLTVEDELRLRAASPIYRHLVGKLAFKLDEGLAGWTVRHRSSAFIPDNAQDDERTNYIPELEEERFQSMVSVPIPSRAGEAIGAMVLHTVAPREFADGILNVLERAASLVAGAIENARLYEDARLRVAALTRFSTLAQEVAAVVRRTDLYRVATSGIRDLLPCDVCRFYELDGEGQLRLAAADPPTVGDVGSAPGTSVLLEIMESTRTRHTDHDTLAAALDLTLRPRATMAVPVAAGEDRVGVLVVAAQEPWQDHVNEILHAAAHQVAVSLKRTELIERLTEENLARDLFEELERGNPEAAAGRARAAGFDLDRPHMVIDVRPRFDIPASDWPEAGERLEAALRRAFPGSVCDLCPEHLRALLATPGEKPAVVAPTLASLEEFAKQFRVVIGCSEGRRSAEGASRSLREASDSARISQALRGERSVLTYRDTGAYRYLIDMIEEGGPDDHLRTAIGQIMAYDQQRRSRLLDTLEEYLSRGRAPASTARALTIHVNTLRQRIDRIEQLSGLDLGTEDLVALQLAIKLARIRPPTDDHPRGSQRPD